MKTAERSRALYAACMIAVGAAGALPWPAAADAASLDADAVLARAAVPDAQLESMRGGLDRGTMIARFGIERIVRVDGEVVARTQLLVDRLDSVTRGQLPDARLIGNLANLVQIGEGNHADTTPQSSAQSSATQAPISGGAVSTSNVAEGLSTDWGTALALAMAIGNGDEPNRPAPVYVGAAPAGSATPDPSGAANAAAPAAGSAADATGTGAPTGGAPLAAPVSLPTLSITIPFGHGSIVVSGIPDAPALATSIQNSVQAARIETETRIDASLSSLSALRSLNFANALRQQVIDSARR